MQIGHKIRPTLIDLAGAPQKKETKKEFHEHDWHGVKEKLA